MIEHYQDLKKSLKITKHRYQECVELNQKLSNVALEKWSDEDKNKVNRFLGDCVANYKQIKGDLVRIPKGRAQVPVLDLKDVSYTLSNSKMFKKSSTIVMPGTYDINKKIVTVTKMNPRLEALASKNKPLKIAFTGSDGRDYEYILKGKEDLKQDERAMQLFSVVNSMVADRESDFHKNLSIQRYNVTPICSGKRIPAGLISYLENSRDVFNTIKEYREKISYDINDQNLENTLESKYLYNLDRSVTERHQCNLFLQSKELHYLQQTRAQDQHNNRGGGQMGGQLSSQYNHINMIKSKQQYLYNYIHMIDGRFWSKVENPTYLSLQQKVALFQHVKKFCSGNDLALSIRLRCATSDVWLEHRTNYTRQLAVMSMVGYILGLGDRHPNNIFLNQKSGKVTHIDLGDCFEEAFQRKQAPEKVQFRLTRMFIKPMEVTGINGIFRHTCISILERLIDNSSTIIKLIDAFVQDPLTNWETANQKIKDQKQNQQTDFQGQDKELKNSLNNNDLAPELGYSIIEEEKTDPVFYTFDDDTGPSSCTAASFVQVGEMLSLIQIHGSQYVADCHTKQNKEKIGLGFLDFS